MTKDVLVLVDAAGCMAPCPVPGRDGCAVLRRKDPFAGVGLGAFRVEGLWHGVNKSPFRNVTLGLKTLADNWTGVDWYCYIEYDCLVAADGFKEDLEAAARDGVWLAGNDHRMATYRVPAVERLVGGRPRESHVMLGCCLFLHREFVDRLRGEDFFGRFLTATNGLAETLPGFDEQGGYDVAEVVYPTLASHYGGRIKEFARWSGGWAGDYERYPMRFRPDLSGEYPDATILHPLKTYDHPLRRYHRELRKRRAAWGDSSPGGTGPTGSCSTSRTTFTSVA